MIAKLSGLTEILPQFEAFLLDIWGVLHDGVSPYPGVVTTLEALQEKGKQVVLLSNAPRRSYVIKNRLAEIGIAAELYQAVHTSGEETHCYLQKQQKEQNFKKCYHLGPPRDLSLFEDLGLALVSSPQEADVAVISGTLKWEQHIEDFDGILGQLLAKNLPLICANADRVVVYQDNIVLCAGAFAERYEAMGGKALFFGKPYSAVYRAALTKFEGVEPEKILAIGDALETDIQGAVKMGIKNALVCGGIHRKALSISWGNLPSAADLENLLGHYAVRPNFILPSFRL